MSATSLINYGEQSQAVALANVKFGMSGARLMTPKEFKIANVIKGSEAKRKYLEYKLREGKVSTVELGKAMMEGKLLVSGYREYNKSGKLNVAFEKVGAVQAKLDKANASGEAAKPVTIDDVWGSMTAEQQAAFIAKSIGAPKQLAA